MKAFTQDRYGSPDVLELTQIDQPVPNDDQVLVQVRAAAVNALDWHHMRGSPFLVRLTRGLRRPKTATQGVDVAGRVEAVGKEVTQFRPGDDVFGWCLSAFAEYASAGENNLLPLPANLTFEQAAAVPIAAFTALQGLRDKGQLQPGQKVLIVGASGGVGTFAVQIAKSFGAEVTGVCSTRNLDLVRSIGADHVIDYTQEDFTRSGHRYDLIFQLAGTASPSACRRALTPNGTLVLSSGDGRASGLDRLLKALVLSRFVSQKLLIFLAHENRADLIVLKELIESGQVTPIIDRTFVFNDVPAAIRYQEDGHTQGKVVVTVDSHHD